MDNLQKTENTELQSAISLLENAGYVLAEVRVADKGMYDKTYEVGLEDAESDANTFENADLDGFDSVCEFVNRYPVSEKKEDGKYTVVMRNEIKFAARPYPPSRMDGDPKTLFADLVSEINGFIERNLLKLNFEWTYVPGKNERTDNVITVYYRAIQEIELPL